MRSNSPELTLFPNNNTDSDATTPLSNSPETLPPFHEVFNFLFTQEEQKKRELNAGYDADTESSASEDNSDTENEFEPLEYDFLNDNDYDFIDSILGGDDLENPESTEDNTFDTVSLNSDSISEISVDNFDSDNSIVHYNRQGKGLGFYSASSNENDTEPSSRKRIKIM